MTQPLIILASLVPGISNFWLGVSVALLFIIIGMITFYNGCVRFENDITAADGVEQLAYNEGLQIVTGNKQALELYQNGKLAVIAANMKGRYGEEGVKAAIMSITENNLDLEAGVYDTLQRAIETLFTKLGVRQVSKVDMIRSYRNFRGTFPRNMFNWIFKFPKFDEEKYAKVVVTQGVQTQYEARTQTEFKL